MVFGETTVPPSLAADSGTPLEMEPMAVVSRKRIAPGSQMTALSIGSNRGAGSDYDSHSCRLLDESELLTPFQSPSCRLLSDVASPEASTCLPSSFAESSPGASSLGASLAQSSLGGSLKPCQLVFPERRRPRKAQSMELISDITPPNEDLPPILASRDDPELLDTFEWNNISEPYSRPGSAVSVVASNMAHDFCSRAHLRQAGGFVVRGAMSADLLSDIADPNDDLPMTARGHWDALQSPRPASQKMVLHATDLAHYLCSTRTPHR